MRKLYVTITNHVPASYTKKCITIRRQNTPILMFNDLHRVHYQPPICRKGGSLQYACKYAAVERTRQHENVKYALAVALRSLSDSLVEVEPVIPDQTVTIHRNDVRFSGSIAFAAGLGPMEFDAQAIGLATNRYQGVTYRGKGGTIWDRARLTALVKLKQAASDKIAGVAVTGSRILQLGQFHPIVFSSGGLMDGGTGGTLERIKKKLQPGAYGHFVITVSVSLARWRATVITWTLVEGVPERIFV